MKKRILSLLLVVVMLALTLTSCSYNFTKDDMSNYTTFDFDAFKTALTKLAIEDGDFTTDPEINAQKIEETIRNTIGKEADADAKLYEGILGTFDILYYAYYATADFEGADDVILYASNMKEASAVKLQLGMTSTAGDLDKAIMEALKEKDIKDYLYKTNADTATELKAGDVVYVSYTYEYVEGTATKKVTATNVKMTLTAGDGLSDKILSDCKNIGTKKDFKVTVDGVERSYKNVVVNWTVTAENKLGEFEVKDFKTEGTDGNPIAVTDTTGTSRKLKDVKDGVITYHVYPVYYLKAPEFTATLVLDTLIGANLTADLFDVFEDESYKTTVDGKEVKLSTLIEELAALCKSRDSAETSLESAEKTLTTKKETLDKAGENATEAQKNAVKEAEEDVAEAKKALEEAEKKVADKIATVFKTGSDVETKIIDGYRKLAKDSLKSQYDSEIVEKIAKEVWALIDSSVKTTSLPEKAVKETYDRILEGHKYTFYTGTKDTTTKESYYKFYNGSFEAYLIATLADKKTYDDALAVVRKEAEEAVATIVKVYAVAEKFDCVVSDEEYKEDFIKGNSSYDYYVDTYGETNLRTVYQFDELMSTILELETYEKDEGDHKEGEMKDYVDGKLPFKNIKYELKAEEEEKKD